MSILFDWYKNPNSNPDDGEEETAIHPRIHYNGATDTNELRRQIQRYCTVSETDVSAVLDALSHCMGKELAEGRKVHLKGIGYFSPTLTCTERVTASTKHKTTKVRLKGITFRSDNELKKHIGNIKVKCLKLGGPTTPITEETIIGKLTEYFRTHPVLRRKDLEFLCGLTSITARRRIVELTKKGKLKNIGSLQQPIYVPGEEL